MRRDFPHRAPEIQRRTAADRAPADTEGARLLTGTTMDASSAPLLMTQAGNAVLLSTQLSTETQNRQRLRTDSSLLQDRAAP